MYTTLWATFLVAFVLSLVMTPAAIKLAPKIGEKARELFERE